MLEEWDPWYEPPRRRASFDEWNILATSSSTRHDKANLRALFPTESKSFSKDYQEFLQDKLQLQPVLKTEETRQEPKPWRRVSWDEANILATSSAACKKKMLSEEEGHVTGSSTSFETPEESLRVKLKARRRLFRETKRLLDQNLKIQALLNTHIEALRLQQHDQGKPRESSCEISFEDALCMLTILQEGQEVMQMYLLSRRKSCNRHGRDEINHLHNEVLEMLNEYKQ